MEILRVENLCKTYGSGENEVRALDNVSFSVKKGEFVAIIGPSGSGKSTLLHILGGVDKPTSGKVFMDDSDVYTQNDEQLAI
ncbi:MAG: ATP-binding cassette domain-containing protein, partial [Ruminococcus sp.]|nr:ATP-binding cassette domain-containing protein [Ruminococcus sp.]